MNYDYSYNYDMSTAAGTMSMAAMIPYIMISLGVSILTIVALWKVFEKCGEEGWKSIIPIYNIITLFKIVGLKPGYVALALIPCVGPFILLVFMMIAYVRLAKKLGKTTTGWALLMIFFTPIALIILAFDKNCVVTSEQAASTVAQPQTQFTNAAPVEPIAQPTNDINNANTMMNNQPVTPVAPVVNPEPVAPVSEPTVTPVEPQPVENTPVVNPEPIAPVSEPTVTPVEPQPMENVSVASPEPIAPVINPVQEPVVESTQVEQPISTPVEEPQQPVIPPIETPAQASVENQFQNVEPPVIPTINDNNNE